MFDVKSNANGGEEEHANAPTIGHLNQTIQTLNAVICGLDQRVESAENKGMKRKLENDELKRQVEKLHRQLEISISSVADVRNDISVAKLADAHTKIHELKGQLMAKNSKITQLEDDLKRANDDLRVLDEDMTEMANRHERVVRKMTMSEKSVIQHDVGAKRMCNGSLTRYESANGNGQGNKQEIVDGNHIKTSVRRQFKLEKRTDDEEKMDENEIDDEYENGEDENNDDQQGEVEQQQSSAIIGAIKRKYGRGRNDKKTARVMCKKCKKLVDNYASRMREHAAIHLDQPIYCCQLCTTYKSKQYDSATMKRHLRDVHHSTTATEFDNNRIQLKAELKKALWECFEYDYGV